MTPVFQFSLYNDDLGLHYISDPMGWDECELSMERHPKYHSLIEMFDGDFIFYGNNGIDDGGFEWIMQCISEQGHRCKMFLRIEISFDMGSSFDELWYGQLDISQKEVIQGGQIRQIKMPVLRGDAWNTFINYQGNKVNIRSTTTIGGEGCTAQDYITLLMKSQQIAFKTEYDGHSGAVDTLDPASTRTVSNISLSGLQIISGLQTTPGMRVLVMAQSTGANNGVYTAASGSWSRSTDANTADELNGAVISVIGGNASGVFKQTATIVTVGVTSQTWSAYNYVDDEVFWEDPNTRINTRFDIFFNPTADPIVKEIENSYTTPIHAIEHNEAGGGTEYNDISEQIEPVDGFGEMTIDWDLLWRTDVQLNISGGGTVTQYHRRLRLMLQINDDAPTIIDQNDIDTAPPPTVPEPYEMGLADSLTIQVSQGDRIKVFCHYYFFVTQSGSGGFYTSVTLLGGLVHTNVKFTFNSKQQENQVSAFYLHDVGGAILDRITDDPGLFYSSYFGSPATKYRSYGSEGAEWKYALVRGLQLRNYPLDDKPYFTSWDNWWQGVDNIFCLGLDPTVISGQPRWEVVPRELLYDSSSVSTDFMDVPQITTTCDLEKFYKRVKIGFDKWEAEDVNGIDDPQTRREYASMFALFGEEIMLYSTFIAASLAIEVTRRKSQEESTDWKYDDNEFIIALGSDGMPEQGASSTVGLNNPSTRYNVRLTVARSMERFIKWLSGCLMEYPTDKFTFQEGVGNFTMQSDLNDGSLVEGPYAENGDFTAIGGYLFPELKSFESTSAWEQWQSMKNNRRLAIGASAANHPYKKLLPQKVSFKPAKGTLSFSGWSAEP